MAIDIRGINEYNDKHIIVYILQIITIYNAIKYGWKIRKIGYKTYELSKKIYNCEDINLEILLNKLTTY